MSTAGISGMMFRCVFEGSLSMQDTEIERRPYHKNCGCALHSNAGVCSNACQRNISFPKKQSWSDGTLCMQASAINFQTLLVGDMSTLTSTVGRQNMNGIHNLALSNRRGVTAMMFQCVFEGSLSMHDTEIERRPYHKNCSCALHSKSGVCSNACQRNLSFPRKQLGTNRSLCMQATATTSKFSSALVTSTSTGNSESVTGVHNTALSRRQ
ncbi:hypothetical protein DVH24_029032 [Malus domestica]|uniref:Uncharacterized protein n=1 Tax=Malus domestica TaxID=3750 RepID=A0A498HYR5_MALDO|nr:hypothetical protein DVH24_029032 [Malus domestica]